MKRHVIFQPHEFIKKEATAVLYHVLEPATFSFEFFSFNCSPHRCGRQGLSIAMTMDNDNLSHTASNGQSSTTDAARTSKPTKKRKVIGIIGGSGPEAGADLFGKILARHRSKMKDSYISDRDAPNILLWSVSELGGPRTKVDLEPGNPNGTYDASLKALLETVAKMAPLVDVFGIACNTLHVFEPHIRSELKKLGHDPSMFISIIETTLLACQARLFETEKNDSSDHKTSRTNSKIAILGGPPTMDLEGQSSYKRLRETLGTNKVHIPSQSSIETIRAIIWKTKADGRPPSSGCPVYENYCRVLSDLANHGVSLCVLACTELPLIHTEIDRNIDIPTEEMDFLDPTEVLADALLEATQDYSGIIWQD